MKSFWALELYVGLFVCGALAGCGGSGGGGNSGGSNNSTLSIASLSPSSAPQDGQAFTLTVNGSGFVSGSQVLWGPTALTTSYTSASQLTAQVPATDLTSQGMFAITVSNPQSGKTSAAFSFNVGNPAPVLSTIQPVSASAGSAAITLTLTGSNFLSNSQVTWNGSPLTTTYVNSTTLTAQVPASNLVGAATNVSASVTVVNPAPNGGTSASAAFQVLAAPLTYVRTINLPANDIVWDSTHGKMYASLPSSDTNGNSVVAIDPVSGSIGTPQPAGNGPDVLALSDDDSFLYVGLDATGAISRFNLPNLTPDPSLSIQLPTDPLFGQLSAISLAVAPGNPHTLAVRIGTFHASPNDIGGVAIYDDSTMRPNALSYPATDVGDVEWGAGASVLYGSAADTSGDFSVMTVDSSGISSVSTIPNADVTFGNIHYDPNSGLAYMDGGWVIDPAHGGVAGAFDLNPMISYFNPVSYTDWEPLCVLDEQRGIVYFLGQTGAQNSAGSGVTLQAFNAKTYALMGTLSISGPTGYLGRFIRWGTSGLAFIMSPTQFSNPGGGPIYLVDGNFVNQGQTPDSASGTPVYVQPSITAISPQSAVSGSPGLTLSVTGNNFFPSSTIQWGSYGLQTTFVSSTELQATISSANLATPGNVMISVSDSTTGLTSPASVAFTVLPSTYTSTTIIPMNLASLNIAWDGTSQQLLLPVWSADSQYPNTVVGVNPATGTVVHVAQVQPDPYAFGVTDDGSYVYTGYLAANYITRLSLPNLDAPMAWTLPTDPEFGPLWTWDLRPAPGAANTIAADFAASDLVPPQAGKVTIYDDGVARAQAGSPSYGGDLEWGAGNAQLYVAPPNLATAFISYNVSPSGLTFAQNQSISGPSTGGPRLHFDPTTGYLYIDNGSVFDPVAGATVGSFNASGLVAVDAPLNRVFILGQAGNAYAIESFNKTTYAETGYLPLPDLIGTPLAFIRWGSNGLAIVTDNKNAAIYGESGPYAGTGPAGMVYIINDTQFVSADAVLGNGNGVHPRLHSFERPTLFSSIRHGGVSGSNR